MKTDGDSGDDVYRHRVFFSCPAPLRPQQRAAVLRHFCLIRKSGGGDCGALTDAGGTMYSVAFRSQAAQQRVLQRSEHVVLSEDGPLVLTVLDSVDSGVAPASLSQSGLTSAAPPSGEEYELRPDKFLFRYLTEVSDAWKELESEFSSLGCSAQLLPEEDRVLVQRLAGSSVGRSLEGEVDVLMEGYQCHYELDPQKVKALLQPCSSHQSPPGEVQVYSEPGKAVVVGKRCQVQARLTDVEDFLAPLLRSPSSEKQSSTHRLGEAKLLLLWGAIENGLGQSFPGVKVTRGDVGQVVLEGSLKEVVRAGEWISEKDKEVVEMTVPHVSPILLAFLKKAYGGPGQLRDLLGVSEEVEAELRDTELRLYSLSPDKLDHAGESLRDKVKERQLELSNHFALSREIRETLRSKMAEMNRERCTVQVRYDTTGSATVFGLAEEVEGLDAAVREVVSGKTLPLPFPELAEDLREFLPLLGLKLTDVILHPVTLSSGGHMVVLEGPPNTVGQVGNLLGPFLRSLIRDTADLLTSLNLSGGGSASSGIIEGLHLVVCQGDCSHWDEAAPGDRVDPAVHVKQIWKVPEGYASSTGRVDSAERFMMEQAVHFSLSAAERMKLGAVVMPCARSGSLAVSISYAEAVATAVKDFGSQGGRSLSAVVLMTDEDEAAAAAQEACERVMGADRGRVRVEALIGTIETQQVDVLVSPMIRQDPLSTGVGQTLSDMGGPTSDLITRFVMADGRTSEAGDAVVVEGSNCVLAKAVVFLHLIPRQGAEDFTAVQVMRTCIYNLLTSCDARGFRSVAMPVLGGGNLFFPPDVFQQVLMDEVESFERDREMATPLLVRVVVHPEDLRSFRVFEELIQGVDQLDRSENAPAPDAKRYILLGKSGIGKSTLANQLLGSGAEVFATGGTANSKTHTCQAEPWGAAGRDATLIDTPGFFDTDRSEAEIRTEITRFVAECAEGIHAFLLVLHVGRYTEQEHQVVLKILSSFSAELLEFAVVVFTHGNQLPDGQTIGQFVEQNSTLRDLVAKCGGRCHVFDNKYWNGAGDQEYRSNSFQRRELLKTLDRMQAANGGRCFTSQGLHELDLQIQTEAALIESDAAGTMLPSEVAQLAKRNMADQILNKLVSIATGSLLAFVFSGGNGLFSVLAGLAGGALALNAADENDTPLEAAGKAFIAVSGQKPLFTSK